MPRIERINEEIRHQVSLILQRDIHDQRIGFVTITKVDTAPDLRSADIYFTTIEAGSSSDDTFTGLKASAKLIRGLLAKRMRVKFIPKIRFINDNSNISKNRIDEIIDILNKEKESHNDTEQVD